MWPNKAGTDVFLDAAGVPAVVGATALGAAKRGAKLGIVAVHKEPISIDFMNVMSNELTIVGVDGLSGEILRVTGDIVEQLGEVSADHRSALSISMTSGRALEVWRPHRSGGQGRHHTGFEMAQIADVIRRYVSLLATGSADGSAGIVRRQRDCGGSGRECCS